jgi:class 3 adenylate cyclase
MERRLAAILAADMAGYSRLMAADEERVLARQAAHRKELIDPKIAEYGGHIFKTTGDGFLVEFPSVVDALRSAVTIQLAMSEREAASDDTQKIAYRMGINLGDIIIKDDRNQFEIGHRGRNVRIWDHCRRAAKEALTVSLSQTQKWGRSTVSVR